MDSEYKNLEQSIIDEGCRDHLIVWNGIIVDGHNRHLICSENNIDFKTIEKHFEDEIDAKIWILKNQRARRNLSPFCKAEAEIMIVTLTLLKDKAQKNKGGDRKSAKFKEEKEKINVDNIVHIDPEEKVDKKDKKPAKSKSEPLHTRKELAEKIGIGEVTAGKIIKITESKNVTDEQREKLRTGDASVNEVYKEIRKAEINSDTEKKHKANLEDSPANFNPLLYNIWNLSAKDRPTDFFGAFPFMFMENLLYYHTKKDDLVYDPFAGSGTTVEACMKWDRRFYCTDLTPINGNIQEWDINKGLPENLPEVNLAFLDPPYALQAAGKYSDKATDLGNTTMDEFYKSMSLLLSALSEKKVERIAIVIQATQYNNNFVFEDHIFKFNEMLSSQYYMEMRYILPYSAQQYTPQQVIKAKEKRICLGLNRDLVVWQLKNVS